jgi:hypothetical protein
MHSKDRKTRNRETEVMQVEAGNKLVCLLTTLVFKKTNGPGGSHYTMTCMLQHSPTEFKEKKTHLWKDSLVVIVVSS